MTLRRRFSAIWRDPVGSNVIAAAIISAVGYAYLKLTANVPEGSLLANPLIRVGAPGLLIIALLILLNYIRSRRKTLVFLSSGGTCRDPMAKVIVEQLLGEMKPRPPIDIRAAGLGPLSAKEASYGARYAIRELYGRDLLKNHRPELLTSDLVDRADLILAMDTSLLTTPGKTLPKSKTFLLKEFLGSQGDVIDPWPDGKDTTALERYRTCAEELRTLLTQNMDRIVKALEVWRVARTQLAQQWHGSDCLQSGQKSNGVRP